jgi:RHS repeat-associated protein
VEYLFTGKQVDAETGWYNFGARYLDPKTGIWLSSDPALGEYIPRVPLTKEDKEANGKLPGNGGIYNPVNFALYHFAGNNPIRYTDPDGRVDWGAAGTHGLSFVLGLTEVGAGGALVVSTSTTGVGIAVGTAVAIDGGIRVYNASLGIVDAFQRTNNEEAMPDNLAGAVGK